MGLSATQDISDIRDEFDQCISYCEMNNYTWRYTIQSKLVDVILQNIK